MGTRMCHLGKVFQSLGAEWSPYPAPNRSIRGNFSIRLNMARNLLRFHVPICDSRTVWHE